MDLKKNTELTDEELLAMTDAELSLVDGFVEDYRSDIITKNPAKSYIPNESIGKLINAVGNEQKKWIFLLPSANGVGKTAGCLNILINIIWGTQNPWFKGWRFENWQHPHEFWYISEQTTLKDVVCGISESGRSEVRKWFPKGQYSFVKAGYEYYSSLTTKNGWTGTFKTFDMEPSKFESATIGVAIFDEPPPKEIFNAVMARMRMGGIVLMPMTPLYSAAWVYDDLIDEAEKDPNSEIFVLVADIEEACIEHGVRGHLRHEDIERMVARYDEDEKAARAEGKFMHLTGLVYRGLHEATHRPETFHAEDFNTDDYRIFNICDPHDARPPMLAWVAVDENRRARIIDEFPSQPEFVPFHKIQNFNWTTEQVCQHIKEKETEYGWDPYKIIRVMDPNFGRQKKSTVGLTVQQYWRKIGREIEWPLRYHTNVHDDIAIGHREVRDWLKVADDGLPLLLVSKHCQNIWYDLTHYSWKKRSGKRLDVDGPGEMVAQKFKDGSDLIRYFAMFLKGPKPLPENKKDERPEHYAMYDDYTFPSALDWRDPFNV